MTEKITLVVLGVFLMVGCSARESGISPRRADGIGKAMWIWEDESFSMLDDPEVASEAAAFLRDHGFTTAYVYADRRSGRNPIVDEPEKYRSLIRYFHENGIKVHALLGSKYLHTELYYLPEKRSPAEALVRRVFDYNNNSDPGARFDGINIDIEPYVTDEWDEAPKAVSRQYLDLSRRYMDMKAKYGFDGEVGVAIPFWYDGRRVTWKGRNRPLNQHVQDLYDYVALMDYRDEASGRDGIIRHAKKEIIYGEEIGKNVVVGLETKRNDLSKLTFHDDSLKDLNRAMAKTRRAFRSYASFAGFAIHHYGSYRPWVQQQNNTFFWGDSEGFV